MYTGLMCFLLHYLKLNSSTSLKGQAQICHKNMYTAIEYSYHELKLYLWLHQERSSARGCSFSIFFPNKTVKERTVVEMPLASNVLEDSAIDQLAPVLQGFHSVVNQTNRQQPVHQLASRKRLFVQVPPEIQQFVPFGRQK